MRASDQDRERVVEILRVAAGDGRLTSEELDERLEKALSARTGTELTALTADLPAVPGLPATTPPQAKEVVKIDQRFGNVTRTGRWVVPQRMEIKLSRGNAKLDFTTAVITHDTLQIDAELGGGGDLILITRPGVVVDAGDMTVSRGDIKVREAAGTGAPVVLRVHLSGSVRGGNVVARQPRRSFGQWLRNGPHPHQEQP